MPILYYFHCSKARFFGTGVIYQKVLSEVYLSEMAMQLMTSTSYIMTSLFDLA